MRCFLVDVYGPESNRLFNCMDTLELRNAVVKRTS